jgi:hypothetical protein
MSAQARTELAQVENDYKAVLARIAILESSPPGEDKNSASGTEACARAHGQTLQLACARRDSLITPLVLARVSAGVYDPQVVIKRMSE